MIPFWPGRVPWLRLLIAAAAVALPSALRAVATATILDGAQLRVLSAADLSGGAGSDFAASQTFSSTFSLQVTTTSACQVSVSRSTGAWLVAGDLLVQVKSGGTFAGSTLVDASPRVLISSATALVGELFELRYQVRNVSVRNPPGTYTAVITYTVTES